MTERPFDEELERESNEEIQARLLKTRRDLATANEKYSVGARTVSTEELEERAKTITDLVEKAGAENIIEEIRKIREAESRK